MMEFWLTRDESSSGEIHLAPTFVEVERQCSYYAFNGSGEFEPMRLSVRECKNLVGFVPEKGECWEVVEKKSGIVTATFVELENGC